MTTPGGGENFQIGDDSVVAKLSVEIPSGSAESLHAINQQTEQLRVSLEAVSRANSSWLEYLQQVPTLTQQAAEAQRDLLVQLERTSYIQQNLGGLAQQTSGGVPQLAQPYSTAAPMGFVDPFMGMTAGMGVGGPQNSAQSTAYMQQLATQNPRVMANLMAQNGMNPATAMGMFGAGMSPSGIWTPPGASMGGGTGPGTGALGNVGGGVPQPGAGGLPGGGGGGQPAPGTPPGTPGGAGGPGGGAPPGLWGQMQNLGQNVMNQTSGSRALGAMGTGALANLVGQVGGGGGGTGGGGGGGGNSNPPPPGGAPGSGQGRSGSILATAMGANQIFQGAGEQIQQFRNLGGQKGGGAIEGIGLETEARTLALDPFMNLEQSRSVLQTAMSSGLQGKEYETLVHMMTENLKNLNMNATTTKELFDAIVVKGGQSAKDFEKTMADTLDYSRTGYVRRDEKIQQTKAVSGGLADLGFSGEAQKLMTRTATEGYADNPILAHTGPQLLAAGMGNDVATTIAGRSMGITGLPDEVRLEMSNNPEAAARAMEEPMRQMAQRATAASRGNENRAVAMFKSLMEQMGMQMTLPEAQQHYRRIMGGKGAFETGEKRAADIAQGDPSISSRVAETGGGIANRAQQLLGLGGGDRMADTDSGHTMAGAQGPVDQASPEFASAAHPRPQMPSQASGPISVQTHGQVNGQLVVTIDQQTGKASAPPTVRLSGTQTSVNSGQGGGSLANVPPGSFPGGNGMSP